MTNLKKKDLQFTLETIKRPAKLERPMLGVGGCGMVELVQHKSDPSVLCAMKTIPLKKDVKLFRVMDEIRLHKSVNHPNIIRVLGSQFRDNQAIIFLEYASKRDLFSILHNVDGRQPSLAFKQKIKIFIECLKATNHLHQRGIIHRDIKLENILFDGNFSVKLCDFGWAVEASNPRRRKSLSGTVEYMSPEIFQGQYQTPKVDVWALGKAS